MSRASSTALTVRTHAPRNLGRIDRQTPELIILVLALGLIAAGLAIGENASEESDRGGGALPSERRVLQIERDVERLRGQKFKKRVVPKVVSPDEAREDALRDVDRSYPAAQREADEELLKLLALVPADTDIFDVLEKVSGEQVVGYYDTRRKTMRLVSGNGADSPALVDITLAHELVHALEDQVFGSEEPKSTTDDEATAATALAEGTATYVMNEFAQCCVNARDLALGSLGALFGTGATGLPPYIERSLLFSYSGGEDFVRELHDATGDWALVDAALKGQPPVSTEQIIHPEKYVPFEAPLDVKLRVQPILGEGWKRASAGSLGELDTRELLRLGDEGDANDGAAGWGGGRYELWRRGGKPHPDCGNPCRQRDALVLSWRWDSARDAREFEPLARTYVTKGLKGRPAGRDVWGLDGGAVALSEGLRETTLAWAPNAALARRLAERAPVSSE